jgi:hopanoid C-2 methylase
MRGDGRFGKRRILCVFPRYTRAFGTWEHAYPLTDGVQAFMPPQGLLLIAAYLPADWEVRFIDENIRSATPEDFTWAEAVFVSGMHIQKRQMIDIARRAHEHNIPAAIGGPSVSACPENYPTFDYLHVGELGDATDQLIARLASDPSRPPQQVVLKTVDRLDMAKFPIPAYELVDLRKYLLANIQFSSGCPYQCEFCDIPALYGRNPRLKTPQQLVAELDKLLECGLSGSVYFVDDNFIGNRKAALELLPHLVEWQKRTGFQVQLACEATLNIAKRPEILRLMREAYFTTIFCGIETTDPAALKSIAKDHNMMVPIMEAIQTLNSYGIEIASGIILGLDTDKADTVDHILQFAEESKIPLLTINLLQALPKTPLWDRLKREGRLVENDEDLESNVMFKLPYDDVVAMWRRAMSVAYEPGKVLSRYLHQCKTTYPNRIKVPNSPERASWKNIKRGLTIMRNIIWQLGIVGSYKRAFWSFAGPLLLRGRIEDMMAAVIVAHHVIVFSREASEGKAIASYYSNKLQEAAVPAE